MQNNRTVGGGVRSRDRGVNRVIVRAGDERVILFEKHPPPPNPPESPSFKYYPGRMPPAPLRGSFLRPFGL